MTHAFACFSLQHRNHVPATRCGSTVFPVPGPVATNICFQFVPKFALTLDALVLLEHSGMGNFVFLPTPVQLIPVILVSKSLCQPGALSQHKS